MNREEFNEAVYVLGRAARVLAPSFVAVNRVLSAEDVNRARTRYSTGDKFPVSSIGNEHSIFGKVDALYFRAWNMEWCFKTSHLLDDKGDVDAYYGQRKELIKWLRDEEITLEVQAYALNVLFVELVERRKREQETGQFLTDQLQFTLEKLGIVD